MSVSSQGAMTKARVMEPVAGAGRRADQPNRKQGETGDRRASRSPKNRASVANDPLRRGAEEKASCARRRRDPAREELVKGRFKSRQRGTASRPDGTRTPPGRNRTEDAHESEPDRDQRDSAWSRSPSMGPEPGSRVKIGAMRADRRSLPASRRQCRQSGEETRPRPRTAHAASPELRRRGAAGSPETRSRRGGVANGVTNWPPARRSAPSTTRTPVVAHEVLRGRSRRGAGDDAAARGTAAAERAASGCVMRRQQIRLRREARGGVCRRRPADRLRAPDGGGANRRQ